MIRELDEKRVITDLGKAVYKLTKLSKDRTYTDWDGVPENIAYNLGNTIAELEEIVNELLRQSDAYRDWEESLYDRD